MAPGYMRVYLEASSQVNGMTENVDISVDDIVIGECPEGNQEFTLYECSRCDDPSASQLLSPTCNVWTIHICFQIK